MDKYIDDGKESIWTKYKIVVPTERDRDELIEAFEHIHYSDIDTQFVAVNQLAHEYLTEEVTGDPRTKNNIIVDPEVYYNKCEPKNESFNTMIYNIERLTKFQQAYIIDVNYYNLNNGQSSLLIDYIAKKYNKVIEKDDLIEQIDDLIDRELITIKTKRIIFNGNWKTNRYVNINYENVKKLIGLGPEPLSKFNDEDDNANRMIEIMKELTKRKNKNK